GSSGSEYTAMMSDPNLLGGFEDPFGVPDPNHPGSYAFYTADPSRNAYAAHWGDPNGPPKRLDYLLIRQGTEYQVAVDSKVLRDAAANTQLFLNTPGWNDGQRIGYLSDHFGLAADLRMVRYIALDPATGQLQVQGGPGFSVDTVRVDGSGTDLVVTVDD